MQKLVLLLVAVLALLSNVHAAVRRTTFAPTPRVARASLYSIRHMRGIGARPVSDIDRGWASRSTTNLPQDVSSSRRLVISSSHHFVVSSSRRLVISSFRRLTPRPLDHTSSASAESPRGRRRSAPGAPRGGRGTGAESPTPSLPRAVPGSATTPGGAGATSLKRTGTRRDTASCTRRDSARSRRTPTTRPMQAAAGESSSSWSKLVRHT